MISKPMIGQFVFLFVWNCLYILFRLQMWVIEHTIFVLKPLDMLPHLIYTGCLRKNVRLEEILELWDF